MQTKPVTFWIVLTAVFVTTVGSLVRRQAAKPEAPEVVIERFMGDESKEGEYLDSVSLNGIRAVALCRNGQERIVLIDEKTGQKALMELSREVTQCLSFGNNSR